MNLDGGTIWITTEAQEKCRGSTEYKYSTSSVPLATSDSSFHSVLISIIWMGLRAINFGYVSTKCRPSMEAFTSSNCHQARAVSGNELPDNDRTTFVPSGSGSVLAYFFSLRSRMSRSPSIRSAVVTLSHDMTTLSF